MKILILFLFAFVFIPGLTLESPADYQLVEKGHQLFFHDNCPIDEDQECINPRMP